MPLNSHSSMSGIECPRGSRPGQGGLTFPAEEYGEEALAYTKDLVIQREVCTLQYCAG